MGAEHHLLDLCVTVTTNVACRSASIDCTEMRGMKRHSRRCRCLPIYPQRSEVRRYGLNYYSALIKDGPGVAILPKFLVNHTAVRGWRFDLIDIREVSTSVRRR